MADVTQIDGEKTEASGEDSPVGGGILRAAREKQKISVLEIAKELHLDEQKVRALEDNQFDTLGAPVFAKGHLRKYAEIVGIEDRDVLADYYELTRSSGAPPVVGERGRTGRRFSPGPWVAILLVVLVVAFFLWSFTSGPESTLPDADVPAPSDEVDSSEAESAPAIPAAVPDAAPEPPATESDEPLAPAVVESDQSLEPAAADVESNPAPAAVQQVSEPVEAEPVDASPEPEPVADREEGAQEEPEAAPADTAERVTLSLAFAEDCWTEVVDNTGERLFFNLGRADTNVTVSGVPPLSVLLGSAYGVSITVDGQAYTINPADRRGRTARLTLP